MAVAAGDGHAFQAIVGEAHHKLFDVVPLAKMGALAAFKLSEESFTERLIGALWIVKGFRSLAEEKIIVGDWSLIKGSKGQQRLA